MHIFAKKYKTNFCLSQGHKIYSKRETIYNNQFDGYIEVQLIVRMSYGFLLYLENDSLFLSYERNERQNMKLKQTQYNIINEVNDVMITSEIV